MSFQNHKYFGTKKLLKQVNIIIISCYIVRISSNGRSKAFSKKKNPTTNRIVACDVKDCKSLVCVYNMKKHYMQKHEEVEAPEMITSAEFEYISGL